MSVFKAYDIRGIYPDEVNKELAYKIGRAFVIYTKTKKVVIGKDVRISSDELEEGLIQGIIDQGADCVLIGAATTPMMYYAVAEFDNESGIMITASHNPKEYNGFKMVIRDALPLSGDCGIGEIKVLVENGMFENPNMKGNIFQMNDILDRYMLNILEHKKDFKQKLKIVVDSGNGMAALVVDKLFSNIDCELFHMFSELDGTFPNHEANPLKEENTVDIRKKIVEFGADMGVAFDGDCDRAFIFDERGEVIRPDLMTALVSVELLKEKKSAFMYDLRSSRIVKELIEKNGGKAIMCRVGHAFIKRQMREHDARFAGELSGHYYFQDNHYYESPFFVILMMMRLMDETGKKLSEIIAPLNKYCHSGEINSKVDDKEGKMKEIAEKFGDAKNISYIDGVYVEYEDWWLNVRPSNTEPLLRLNLEAKTEEMMNEKRDLVLGIIRG